MVKVCRTAKIAIIILILITMYPVQLLADSVGPKYPSTVVDDSSYGAYSWSNPSYATSSDTSYTTSKIGNDPTHYLKATGFDFSSIPSDATINGIKVEIQRYKSGSGSSITDRRVSLLKSGSIVGDNKADTSSWPTTDTWKTYGGSSDLWDTTWTVSDIQNSNFGVVLSAQASNTEYLDESSTTGTSSAQIYSTRRLGQNFKVDYDILTRIELYVEKDGVPADDLYMNVRKDSMTGTILASTSVSSSDVPATPDWVEFDFDDIDVSGLSEVYIEVYSSGGSASNCYRWMFSNANPYSHGMLHFSSNGGASWSDYSSYDCQFKSYGCYSSIANVNAFRITVYYSSSNTAPSISSEYPSNSSASIELQPHCHVYVSDSDGDTMTVKWYENTTGSWVLQQTNSSVTNGTYYWTYTNASSYSTTYYWKVEVDDGTDTTTAIYHFTTVSNSPPSQSNPYPGNGSTGINAQPTCHIQVSDSDGDTMDVKWYENTTGSWVLRQTNSSVVNGTYYWTYTQASQYSTTYYWKVEVDDGTDSTTEIYHFTTGVNSPPEQSNPNPSNNSETVLPTISQISIYISDPNGDSMNWTIETSPDIGSSSGNNEGNGTKTCSVSGVQASTWYTWYVNVTDGTDWTNRTYHFTTIPQRPQSFTATAYNSSVINLSWSKGVGADYTYIRYSDDHYPYNRDDGTLLCNTTGTNYSATGLQEGTTYYFRGWSYNTTYNAYSTFSSSASDTTYTGPTIKINFAGNLSDKGGPYWRPPTESEQLTGVFSDGYYTNASKQHEDWIYINCTIENATTVYLNWLNETTWTNETYTLTHTSGNYWEINTSGIISVSPGYNYSFDIKAYNSTSSRIARWEKVGIGGELCRRYVQLGCSVENISYNPYYYHSVYYSTAYKKDRLKHDQGPYGASDTGILDATIPGENMEHRECSSFVGFFFDETVCIPSWKLQNIYFHVWWSTKNGVLQRLGYNKTRDTLFNSYDAYISNINANDCQSHIYWDSGDVNYNKTFNLYSGLLNVPSSLASSNYVDNDIYEFVTVANNSGEYPMIISNRSVISFIIFNVPSNSTLSGMDSDSDGLNDYQELYVTYTNPFLSDTDNDGYTDYNEHNSGSDPNNYSDIPSGNVPPQLTSPSVTPSTGVDSYTVFYFNITWSDADGDDPTDGYLKVNISKTGWYTNVSMTWVSGDNTTGALYTYSTTLTAGSYTYQFWAYDGVNYNHTTQQSGPTVNSQSLSFTVVTSSGNDKLYYKNWTLSLTGVGATTQYNVSEDNDTASIPTMNITNTGNVPLNISLYWLSNPGTGVSMKYNTTFNPPPHGTNTIAVSPSETQVITNLGVGEYEHIWLWMDFENVQAQTSTETVRVNSSLYQ